MADEKKKRGGARPNSGPRPKAERLGLEKLLDDCWSQAERESCIRELARKANAGEMEAVKLLMFYAYGKPVERKEVSGMDGKDIIIRVVYD